MTIKEFAYSAQQHLQAQTGEPFKRAHLYEFLAASFGYHSYAALCSESLLFPGSQASIADTPPNTALRQRCIELGYQTVTADIVSTEFPFLIEQKFIHLVKLPELIATLRGKLFYRGYGAWQDDEEFDEDEYESLTHLIDEDWPLFPGESRKDLISKDLLTALEAAALTNNAEAHYALALLHAPVDADERSPGMDYWYNEEKNGRVLVGVQKEFADEYAEMMAKDTKYEIHLREAGRLGNELALLDLAETFDDPSFFEIVKRGSDHDPLRVAEIAENLGRIDDLYHWLTIAAEAGDVEAMQRLIEEFDQDDLSRLWTWVYLAQLLDTDLTRDNYYAIHEDGSHYDDDVGGTVFMAGRAGIKLRPLSEDQDALARLKAQALYDKIQ
jgi:hypothetical protein